VLPKQDLIKIGVEKGEFPSVIHRYAKIDNYLLESLSESYLWFSNPSKFNDPFDCNIQMEARGNIKQFDEYLKRSLIFKSRDNVNIEMKKWELFLDSKFEYRIQQSLEDFIKKIGVCCFSFTHKDTLMWSYYADKHMGVCLSYNLTQVVSEDMVPFRVRYKEEYPLINWVEHSYQVDNVILTMGTKSKDWEHEKEFRVVSEKIGKNYIPKQALKSIYFGCNVRMNDRKNILQIIKEQYANNQVELKKATLMKKKFGLEFLDV